MTSKTWTAGTVVDPAWLQDVDNRVYKGKVYDTISFINVKDPTYGALGDGTTDDGPAIQNAINACVNGGVVFFPQSATGYKITTGIVMPTTKSITLLGFGVKLLINSSIGIKVFNLGNGYAHPVVHIDGFYITSFTNGSNTGIQVSDSQRIRISNCKINFLNKGVEIFNTASFTEETYLDNVDFQHNNYGIYMDYGASSKFSLATTNFTHVTISMANAVAAVPYGIYITTNTDIYRAKFVDLVIFLDKNNCVGFYSDGKMQGASGSIHFENNGAATGQTALSFGATATDNVVDLFCNFTGTITTPMSYAGTTGPRGFRGAGSVIASDYRFHMMRYNNWFFWVDPSTGKWYTKSGTAPTTATDGTVIGTQT